MLRLAFASDYSDLDGTVPLLQLAKEAGCLKEGSEGSAFVPGIPVLNEDIVVAHKLPGPSAVRYFTMYSSPTTLKMS